MGEFRKITDKVLLGKITDLNNMTDPDEQLRQAAFLRKKYPNNKWAQRSIRRITDPNYQALVQAYANAFGRREFKKAAAIEAEIKRLFPDLA